MRPTADSIAGNAGIPVAPSLAPTLALLDHVHHGNPLATRSVFIASLACGVALLAGLVAQLLSALIALITNAVFYDRFSATVVAPWEHKLGLLVIVVPVIGGAMVGLMARFGSQAIRGHGIPEAMEQVLFNESRIPVRMTFLKPLSAAIAIGTGGPFGAEGPIIATGGALGSLVGQLVKVTADERKTLLASGAAAGMAATFGSPVSAVLLAVELLLFEYRARSVVPVALAASTACAVRIAFVGTDPVFAMSVPLAPDGLALVIYVAVGVLLGYASVLVTRMLYLIEDSFEHLPVHWMWWPAIGGIAVGVVGWFVPRTLGVGYANIEQTLNGELAGRTLLVLGVAKLISWSISLGSGTSGGTLAPLLTIGGALGSLLASFAATWLPGCPIDPRIGALVGMAAMFAGASRALLASVVFAFECSRQPIGLLPLLAGCTAAYLVSCLAMKNSIMTEKLARRGARVNSEYERDFLDGLLVRSFATTSVATLDARASLAEVRGLLAGDSATTHHQGFPVLDAGALVGVLTRRDLFRPGLDPTAPINTLIGREPVVVYPESSLREAADRMAAARVGRLVVVTRDDPRTAIGILTRSDLLRAHERKLIAEQRRVRVRDPQRPWRRRPV
jgi:H+/Cl- antiporter ClcA/CBS domain-containing protein